MKLDQLQQIIDSAYDQYSAFQKRIMETGYYQEFAQMVTDTESPDEEFLARKILQMTSMFDEIGNMVQYLHKPVRQSGFLLKSTAGWVLKGETIKDGTTLEFMHNGEWQIGKLRLSGSETPSVVSEDRNIVCTELDHLKVRIR